MLRERIGARRAQTIRDLESRGLPRKVAILIATNRPETGEIRELIEYQQYENWRKRKVRQIAEAFGEVVTLAQKG